MNDGEKRKKKKKTGVEGVKGVYVSYLVHRFVVQIEKGKMLICLAPIYSTPAMFPVVFVFQICPSQRLASARV